MALEWALLRAIHCPLAPTAGLVVRGCGLSGRLAGSATDPPVREDSVRGGVMARDPAGTQRS
jgi:hypothetical protein